MKGWGASRLGSVDSTFGLFQGHLSLDFLVFYASLLTPNFAPASHSFHSFHHELCYRLQGCLNGFGVLTWLWLLDCLAGHQTNEAEPESFTKCIHLHDLGRNRGECWTWNTWLFVPQRSDQAWVCINSRDVGALHLTVPASPFSSSSYSSGYFRSNF
jgi:hypothetical protein